jgi:hypothetical protein
MIWKRQGSCNTKTGKKTSTTTETVDNCTAMEADLIPERKQAWLAFGAIDR